MAEWKQKKTKRKAHLLPVKRKLLQIDTFRSRTGGRNEIFMIFSLHFSYLLNMKKKTATDRIKFIRSKKKTTHA